MTRTILILFLCCTFFACRQKADYITENEKLVAENIALQKKVIDSKMLVHTVYFKTRTGISERDHQQLIREIKSLEKINGVIGLLVGRPAETGDERLFTDYSVVLHMGFRSQEDLNKYSKDKFHLEVRERVKDLLAGPPVVYDYWAE